MRRAPFTAAILTIVCGAASVRAEELLREAYPVPDVVDAAFRGGGLAAFDPFDPWLPGSAVPEKLLTPASAGEDGARLPAGVCFDILPAWTARGFQARAGTRVLYHPQAQMLFAKIAPGDEARVRAFCEWPPAQWLSRASWQGWWVRQILLRITCYEVPASGPGDWNFQPVSAAELLALPAAARRILHRQSMVIRGGQRAKVEGFASPRKERDAPVTGMIVEAECTVGEDGSTVDLNVAPELAVRLTDGSPVMVQSLFQQLIPWGDSWLVEAGTLPGNPPRRIFQVWEVLRLHPDMSRPEVFNRCIERWTGRPADGEQVSGSVTGGIFSNTGYYYLPEPAAPAPAPPQDQLLPAPRNTQEAPADPFATPFGPEKVKEKQPAITVPELFGSVPMHDVTESLEQRAGMARGLIRAWKPADGGPVYVRGTPAAMAALNRFIENDRGTGSSVHNGMADVSIAVKPAGAAGPGKTVWRGAVPCRAGQRSTLKVTRGRETGGPEKPETLVLCDIEPGTEELEGPEFNEHLLYNWTLAAGVLLRPFADAPVQSEPPIASGTRDGVSLTHTIGRTAAGEEIVLTIRVREISIRWPQWATSADRDWWWRRQVAKAAK